MSKQRMRREDAHDILQNCGVPVGANFFGLDSETVLKLLAHADTWAYRQPANANGSRGRYWHERLQRIAGRVPE